MKPVPSVFVYADGATSAVMLPVDHPPSNWRRVIRRPLDVQAANVSDPSMLSVEYEQFDLLGEMFDGRPIYCASGFNIEEACQIVFVTMEAADIVDEYILSDLRRFVLLECSEAIELDRWIGMVPWTHQELEYGMDRQCLVKKAARLKVAVAVGSR